MTDPSGVAVGDDGVARCGWADSSPDYRQYHDTEWGVPVHGDTPLFERITLEGFQSGLSWITILRKRPAFRSAFAGFDPNAVAGFDDHRIASLLEDTGIVRNRRKIEATVANARAVRRLQEADGDDALDRLVWSFAPQDQRRPASVSQVPASTPESVALSKALKSVGFVFVGPTTMYAAMQACGLVDDHVRGCHRADG
jgi:DNA-3-methyladenine glycosylase I